MIDGPIVRQPISQYRQHEFRDSRGGVDDLTFESVSNGQTRKSLQQLLDADIQVDPRLAGASVGAASTHGTTRPGQRMSGSAITS